MYNISHLQEQKNHTLCSTFYHIIIISLLVTCCVVLNFLKGLDDQMETLHTRVLSIIFLLWIFCVIYCWKAVFLSEKTWLKRILSIQMCYFITVLETSRDTSYPSRHFPSRKLFLMSTDAADRVCPLSEDKQPHHKDTFWQKHSSMGVELLQGDWCVWVWHGLLTAHHRHC
jgi:hypothetical protein